jgi:integrase
MEIRMKTKLLKSTIDKAQTPASGDAWLWDAEVEGFGLRIQHTGRKTYVVRYRTKDSKRTQRKVTLGRASDMPPEKARELARKVFSQVAEGQDPAADRKPQHQATETTVEKLFEAYVISMESKGRSSASEVRRALLLAKSNVADALGRHRPCNEVTPAELVAYISKVYRSGHPAAADKKRGYVAAAYTWGMQSANDYTIENPRDWRITRNPAAEVPKDSQATKPRDRNLNIDELRALWQATRPDSQGFALETAACIRLLIACGQRVQETIRMDGREIDFKAGTWHIPAHKTKGGKVAHTVPLPACILPDLKLLISINGEGSLFPLRGAGKDGLMPHQSVMQAIERWYQRTGAEPFQTRDLRRTWKSRAADAGVDRFTRDLIQQHAKGDTGSKHYDKADYLPQMKAAMDKWASWIAENLEDKPVLTLAA